MPIRSFFNKRQKFSSIQWLNQILNGVAFRPLRRAFSSRSAASSRVSSDTLPRSSSTRASSSGRGSSERPAGGGMPAENRKRPRRSKREFARPPPSCPDYDSGIHDLVLPRLFEGAADVGCDFRCEPPRLFSSVNVLPAQQISVLTKERRNMGTKRHV